MVSAPALQVDDCRYPSLDTSTPSNLSLMRKQGKISDPEHAFAAYLSGKLDTEVIQQFPVAAFDRKTYNQFFWHLDIYLPAYKLAIEINGQSHYTDPRQFVSDHWKQIDCARVEIVMVSFPCFPPSSKTAYESWCRKMFKYWAKDIEKLVESFDY